MKITGTRSQIKVEIDDKIILINGELTTTPAFYADINILLPILRTNSFLFLS
jgi:hypothetical protein